MPELSKQEILSAFSGVEPAELAQEYKKDTLVQYYQTCFGRVPPSRMRRIDLVKSIQMMSSGIQRAMALKP